MQFRFPTVLAALLIGTAVLTTQLNYAQNSAPTRSTSQQPTSILFENVRIFNGSSAQLSAPSNVLVVDNKIEMISATPITTASGTATRIKGGDRVLMPGLIDNHVHIVLSASSEKT